MKGKVNDLRSALELLRTMEGQLIETDVEVEPKAATLRGVSLCGSGRYGKKTDERRASYDFS